MQSRDMVHLIFNDQVSSNKLIGNCAHCMHACIYWKFANRKQNTRKTKLFFFYYHKPSAKLLFMSELQQINHHLPSMCDDRFS